MDNNISENPMINNYNQSFQRKKNTVMKIFAIIGGIAVGIIVLVVVIMLVVSSNSDKLICKSAEGNITIMYNDSTITGYTAKGMGYNLDEQKIVAEQIGINNYISQFTTWFETNTTGTCTIKEK